MASRVVQASSRVLCRMMVSPRVTTLTEVRASITAEDCTPNSLATVTR